jgi:hypothetical protein
MTGVLVASAAKGHSVFNTLSEQLFLRSLPFLFISIANLRLMSHASIPE